MRVSVNRQIFKLAIPNIISNVTIPMLGIVDIALMGHLENDKYIGAIALGALIFNFIYWGFGFLRMGTSGFTAQAWGKRDMSKAFHVLPRAFLLGIAGGLVLIALQYPISKIGFALIEGEAAVENLAQSYFRIRIWAAPATLGQYALLGWFIGMQNAKFPMIVAITENILNAAVSYFLVIYSGMNADGVAWGTVIAQYFGLLLSVFFYLVYYGKLSKYLDFRKVFSRRDFLSFMSVNKDIFIRTMCLVLVFSYFTAKSASNDASSEGEEMILAVNSLLMQFFMFFSFLIDGFAYAAEALTGKFIGALNPSSLKIMVRRVFRWGTMAALMFSLVYLLAGEDILRLLTNNPEVINNSTPYLVWIIVIPLISFPAFLWDGIFIGATAGAAMRNSMLLSTVVVFFPAYILLERVWGNHGLWLAFVLFLLARGISLFLLAERHVYYRSSGQGE